MKRVSMKHEEGKGEGALAAMPYPQSDFPYGLRLRLEADQLEQLGISEPPKAGTSIELEARGVVVRSSTEDPDADGDVDCICVELQITELGIIKGGGEKREEGKVAGRERKSAAMYGDDDED